MKTKEKREIMFSRTKNLTAEEKITLNGGWYYDRVLFEHFVTNQDKDTPADHVIEQWWNYSSVGGSYVSHLAKARKILSLKDPTILFSKVKKRQKWVSTHTVTIAAYFNDGTLTEKILAWKLHKMDKEVEAIWDSYLNDPVFKVGQIVQLRSNVGVDSVLSRHEWGGRHRGNVTYYGCTKAEMQRLKSKSFVIIEIDPLLDGQCYARAYSYKHGQGGGRYYKVLPLGEAKTYFVVEKYLKKCRTKAVKDARK